MTTAEKAVARITSLGARYTTQMEALITKCQTDPDNPLVQSWEKQIVGFQQKLNELGAKATAERRKLLDPLIAALTALGQPTDVEAWGERVLTDPRINGEHSSLWVVYLLAELRTEPAVIATTNEPAGTDGNA